MIRSILFCCFIICASSAESQSLQRYSCVVDRLNIEAYENPSNLDYSKDEFGVIMDKGVYHPVRVAMYGIMCHQKFYDTGDSSYFHKMVDQTHFYRDATLWDIAFDGKGIGFPYTMDFHDLKTPWYSGMAQGSALSFLLRYREATGDRSFDKIIKKIAYFLIQPEEEGGTISDDDGFLWIEEYPNSFEARHVLNGGLNGFIGLGEYCQVFSDDLDAARVRDACYQFLLKRLPEYTKLDWSAYDLTDRMCNPNYMRYHIFQMRHMFELTGEDMFRNMEMIWSALLDTVPHIETIGLVKDPDHVISSRVIPAAGEMFVADLRLDSLIPANFSVAADEVFDNYQFSFSTPDSIEYIVIGGLQSEEPGEIQIFSLNETDETSSRLEFQSHWVKGQGLRVQLNKKTVVGPGKKLGFKLRSAINVELDVTAWTFFRDGPFSNPRPVYGHYFTTPNRLLETTKYTFDISNFDTKVLKVFYKYAMTREELLYANYSPYQFLNERDFKPPVTGYYKFLIVYKFESLLSIVGELNYREIFD